MNPTKVLIVENDFIEARAIEIVVSTIGCAVCGCVASGEEAIEMADKERPDIVLMDIMLAGAMDGIEAAKEITRRFSIPIIYITGYGQEETKIRAGVSEPYQYLLKPVDALYLERAIKAAVGG